MSLEEDKLIQDKIIRNIVSKDIKKMLQEKKLSLFSEPKNTYDTYQSTKMNNSNPNP